MRIIAACTLALVLASSTQAADVNWKMYGGASVAGPSFCFYDANSVARASSGYVRVWTKCLAQKDLDGLDRKSDPGSKIVDIAAKEVMRGYVPPIVVIGQMEFNQVPEIVMYE